MESDFVFAKDISECGECPLEGKDCKGVVSTPNGYMEPPCTSWKSDTKVYEGMYDGYEEEMLEYYEKQAKRLRSLKAKRAAEERKKYSHLDNKYNSFKVWLTNSSWRLSITSRRKGSVYLKAYGKSRANYVFDLEREKLGVSQGNVSLAGMTTLNRFENDFKEYYYGTRPVDRDYVAEVYKNVNKMFDR